MRPQTDTPRIADLAETQWGVVARAQLKNLGLEPGAIKRRIRAGELHALHRGVYAVGHTVLRAEGRWLAATMACGPGAVLSHASAAALWDLRPTRSSRIDVTVRSSAKRAPEGVRVHRTRRPIETTIHQGIPVTSPARTLADLAETVARRALEKALEQAETLRLLDVKDIDDVADANPGRAGPALVRRLVEVHDVGTFTRSDLEDAFLALCDTRALPKPAVNRRIEGLEVDFSWPKHHLVVEVDGFRYHGTRAAFERDRARDAQLTSAGWRVLRFTDRQVRRDALTVGERLDALLPAE